MIWMENLLIPKVNPLISDPPTILSLMNSIANFDKPKEEQIKIKDLPTVTHSKFFDFNYPLSSKINKDDFEIMFLKKFMLRRIGYDTLNIFKIQLEVKLNEIMPRYNKLFDLLDGWDLFNDGEEVTTTANDSGNSTTNMTTNNTTKTKYSDLPQSNITNIEDGSYITDYTVNDSVGTNGTITNGSNNRTENIKRSPSDKIRIYNDFIENKNNIYTMIFKDLEDLFFQII